MKQEFTNAKTILSKGHYGWCAKTIVTVDGKCWMIDTSKSGSRVSTHSKVVTDNGGCISFAIAFGQHVDSKEDFYLNATEATKVTEKLVTTVHAKSLADMDVKHNAGELPNAATEYKIEVGQVLFTDGNGSRGERAIYEIVDANTYKTVLLDGSATRRDSYVKHYAKKFGIGVYYNEGEKVSPEELEVLLEAAEENMKIAAAAKAIVDAEKADKAKKTADYLSQFKKADKRTTTDIIKRHILATWPTVSNVSVRTDSGSTSDSMDVTYSAPEKIEDLSNFVRSFKEGSFDGMTDMYEYTKDKEAIVLEGHILQTYTYTSTHYEQSNAVRSLVPEPVAAAEGQKATIRHNEQFNGVELYFNGKPSDQEISHLKTNGFRAKKSGGRWYWYKKVSSSALYVAAQYGTVPSSLTGEKDQAGEMVSANEEAMFDNFCSANNI